MITPTITRKPTATNKKQAYSNAGINSLFHTEENTTTIKAWLFMCPIDWAKNEVLRSHWSMSLGRNRLLTVRRGRIERSKAFLKDHKAYTVALWWGLKSLQAKADKQGKSVTVVLPEFMQGKLTETEQAYSGFTFGYYTLGA